MRLWPAARLSAVAEGAKQAAGSAAAYVRDTAASAGKFIPRLEVSFRALS